MNKKEKKVNCRNRQKRARMEKPGYNCNSQRQDYKDLKHTKTGHLFRTYRSDSFKCTCHLTKKYRKCANPEPIEWLRKSFHL